MLKVSAHLGAILVANGLLAWFCVRDGLLGWIPGHYPWTSIQVVPMPSRQLPEIESSRLLSDLPSLLLGLSALGSATLYILLRHHLWNLHKKMRRNSLLDTNFSGLSEFRRLQDPVPRVTLSAIWTISMGAGVGLYFVVHELPIYPRTWWLNHKAGAGVFEHVAHYGRIVAWIFIGSEGVYTALASMLTFLAAMTSLKSLRRRSQDDTDTFQFRYVEPWERAQQGWHVLWVLMRLKVWGVITALPALTGLYLILAQRESLRPLVALIIIGIVVVSLLQFGILNLVPQLYEDTVGRELAKNNRSLTRTMNDVELSQNARRNEHLLSQYKNQRGYSLLIGRLATGLTLATSVAGVVVPIFTG